MSEISKGNYSIPISFILFCLITSLNNFSIIAINSIEEQIENEEEVEEINLDQIHFAKFNHELKGKLGMYFRFIKSIFF